MDIFYIYAIKFCNTMYSSNATYKLLYHTTKTNTTESKNLWQLQNKKDIKQNLKSISKSQIRRHKFSKEAIKFCSPVASLRCPSTRNVLFKTDFNTTNVYMKRLTKKEIFEKGLGNGAVT